MLQEGAAYTFRDRFLPQLSPQEWEAAILHSQEYLHQWGITGWQDAWVTPETLAAYRSLDDSGRLTARVAAALWWERHLGPEQIESFVEQASWGSGGNVSVRTVKIMTDGVLENYTGALLEPYHHGCGDNTGLSYLDSTQLANALTELDRRGFGVHLHAIGDRACRDSLDAVAAAQAANGVSGNRHHIAHIQLIDPADIPRFAELGVTANMQAYWAQRDGQLEDLTRPYLGDERTDRMYPFADLRTSGARIAAGSDWPVSTPDPLAQIEVAIRRRSPDDRGNEPFLPEQALSLSEALDAFTVGSAYVNYDDEAGTIAVGKRADLTILDQDLFRCPDGMVADAKVDFTIASGKIVYSRA
jgi:hypothetical protein